jgi:hypothetical protein
MGFRLLKEKKKKIYLLLGKDEVNWFCTILSELVAITSHQSFIKNFKESGKAFLFQKVKMTMDATYM